MKKNEKNDRANKLLEKIVMVKRKNGDLIGEEQISEYERIADEAEKFLVEKCTE